MNAPEMADLAAGHAEALERFLRGDAAAMAFVGQAFQVAHILDDLIDQDRSPTDDEVIGAFWLALVGLPQNAFYQRHAGMLQPLFATSLLNWMAATKMEQGADPADLAISFVLRSSYVDLLTMSALIVGGLEWAAEITPDIRRWVHHEGFDGYLRNLATEKEARRVR